MMNLRLIKTFLTLPLVARAGSCFAMAASPAAGSPPHVVIIFLEDSGYADCQPFGKQKYETPNVRRLAEEGRRFTRFHVPQAVCSASRSALMSGCWPGRTKVFGAHGPNGRGLDTRFPNLAELLKANGYSTGWFGKWHLGDQPDTRPHARGFDETGGLMYSNDMWEYHPTDPVKWGKVPLSYWVNGEVTIERVTPEHQKMLTTWATERAVSFIERHHEKPFFIYLAHSMPHVPLFVSDKFAGKSNAGLYGDVIMELDWSVGEVMRALREHGIEENTIVIFSSDNGPWHVYGNHAGFTPFREAKGTTFSGGTQSACIIKYPAGLEAGTVSDATFCSIDILPTICAVTGTDLPQSRIDGRNQWPLIRGESGAVNPQVYYPLSNGSNFEGLLTGDGRWKLHLPHNYRFVVDVGNDGNAGKYVQKSIELSLFDMDNDPMESTNVIEQFPEVADRLIKLAEAHQRQFYSK